jgi:hypothetical protein
MRVKLLQAMAPIAAQVQTLELDLQLFQLGRQELLVVGQVFGKLTKLVLDACQVQRDFWPAVAKDGPSLTCIEIQGMTAGKLAGAVEERHLTAFCAAMSRPFTLVLSKEDISQAAVLTGELQEAADEWAAL